MLDRSIVEKVLKEAMSKGGDFGEIYVESRVVTNVFCEDNKIERIHSGYEKGAGIRVISEGNTAYAFTNDLSTNGLLNAARMAAHVARGSSRDITLDFTVRIPEQALEIRKPPAAVPFETKIEKVLAANEAAREAGDYIKQVTVGLADVEKKVLIANSLGDWIEDEITRVRFVVNVVAARDGLIQTGYDAIGGVAGWELLDEVPADELGRKSARRALLMLEARPCPAGRMPVVMSSEAGGTMVHEACGHGLEADLVQKGLSVYRGKLGQKVAASNVSVIDDATLKGKYGQLRFDDEGSRGQRTVLIDQGVLVGYMYDRLTAEKDQRVSTGNGRRESYQHKPIPRMTNTFIAPGPEDPGSIISNTPRGLLVRKMGGGQVNTTNGDFVFEVQEGYIIENGEIKYPVRGATLTGNGPEALKNIDMVGSDLGFAIGQCGKDGQGVPVSDAQPTIRIRQLTVGGTSL
ncbi:MAG: TldD/PmbA family protein [Syntrophomonadaceae bacterium]|nr:TldD/PmbA family protein [Syntrophomonadaceae bacterium]